MTNRTDKSQAERVADEDLARAIRYALQLNRKAIQKLSSTDDEGHMTVARGVVEQLKLSGIETVRRQRDLSPAQILRGPHEGGDL